MNRVVLKLAVREPGGRVLLNPGEVLSPRSLQNLVDANRNAPGGAVSLMEHATVREDLGPLLDTNPYRLIFDDPVNTDTVLRLLERVLVPVELLPFLDHFKHAAPETYDHTLRVTALTAYIGRFLRETVQDLTRGILAAVVHDFGKLCVPEGLLEKRAPLSAAERELLEQHTLAGYALISYFLGATGSLPARAARDHHERRDGSGYPHGIVLQDRMVEIIAVSDIYDALVSDRAYRQEAYENREALEEITEMATAGKIGWDVVRALISHNRETKPDPEACVVSMERRTPAAPMNRDRSPGEPAG